MNKGCKTKSAFQGFFKFILPLAVLDVMAAVICSIIGRSLLFKKHPMRLQVLW